MKQTSSGIWVPHAARLADIFAREGFEIRLVGGVVRDFLAGVPNHDIDLATDATPMEMLELGQKRDLRTIPLLAEVQRAPALWAKGGLKHGTVPVVVRVNGVLENLDITTLRRAGEYGSQSSDGFTRDFVEDARRRDFTINAMNITRSGWLHDNFGGQADLEKGIIRFVGDAKERILEDRIRMLRFFRFRARYGKPGNEIEEKTGLDAIKILAPQMSLVAGERIWSEIAKLLALKRGIEQFRTMDEVGLFSAIGLPSPAGRDMPLLEAGVRHSRNPSFLIGLFLADTLQNSSTDPVGVLRQWRVSIEQKRQALIAYQLAPAKNDDIEEFRRLITMEGAPVTHVCEALKAFGREEDSRYLADNIPSFPVTGAMLLKEGFCTGKEIGVALSQMKDVWYRTGYQATAEELLVRGEAMRPAP